MANRVFSQNLHMIIDDLEHAARYRKFGHRFGQGFDYLLNHNFAAMESGRYAISGEKVFALVQRYESKPREPLKWEAHRRYADIQYIASGTETIGYAPLRTLFETEPYVAEKDVLFASGNGSFFSLGAGAFAVFFPGEAHAPGLAFQSSEPILKVVIKVEIDAA